MVGAGLESVVVVTGVAVVGVVTSTHAIIPIVTYIRRIEE
jgi:hypothetical protein